jgi:hypothetical protein
LTRACLFEARIDLPYIFENKRDAMQDESIYGRGFTIINSAEDW